MSHRRFLQTPVLPRVQCARTMFSRSSCQLLSVDFCSRFQKCDSMHARARLILDLQPVHQFFKLQASWCIFGIFCTNLNTFCARMWFIYCSEFVIFPSLTSYALQTYSLNTRHSSPIGTTKLTARWFHVHRSSHELPVTIGTGITIPNPFSFTARAHHHRESCAGTYDAVELASE